MSLPPITATDVVALTHAAQTTTYTWRGRCPCHDDQTGKDLRIGFGRGDTLLLRCTAKCDFEDLIFELRAMREAAS